MSLTIEELEARLKDIKARRKSGELDERAYYRALLSLAIEIGRSLLDELGSDGKMEDENVRKQIPLLLTFVEDQIARFRAREDARA